MGDVDVHRSGVVTGDAPRPGTPGGVRLHPSQPGLGCLFGCLMQPFRPVGRAAEQASDIGGVISGGHSAASRLSSEWWVTTHPYDPSSRLIGSTVGPHMHPSLTSWSTRSPTGTTCTGVSAS